MKKEKSMVNCIIYVRTSNKKKRIIQETNCLDYAKGSGLKVIKTFYDVGRGFSIKDSSLYPEREGFAKMLNFIKESYDNGKPISFILVDDIFKITRSILCYLELEQILMCFGVNIMTVNLDVYSSLENS